MIVSRLIIIALMFVSCRTDHLPLEPELTLSVADVSCTEVWLKAEGIGSHEFILERDGGEIENYSVISGNIIYDDSLQPNTTYAYRLTRLSGDEKSSEVTVTTMDTTSHDFTWNVYDFGGGSSSILNDIAIINENDIWAVGSISTAEGRYNAVHWDGEKWELKRILYKGGFWDINTIFTFNRDDIWFEAYMKWNGKSFIELEIPEIMTGFSINKTWGTNSNDFYVVGNDGQIRHYNGQNWTKIESATELDIQDIWGSWNEKTGEYEILCVASTYEEHEAKLFEIIDGQAKELALKGLTYYLDGIWFKSGKKYFIGGSGIKLNNVNIKKNAWISYPHGLITSSYIFDIAGNDINDVAAVGGHGEIIHYNGAGWKSYIDETAFYGNLTGVDMKGDMIAAAGYTDRSGRILIGKRN